MSVTKGVAAIAFARLIERGLVDVEAPVTTYWPEFGARGKTKITVAQVLSHAAGLVTVPNVGTWNLENLFLPGDESRRQPDEETYRAKLNALATTINGLEVDVLAV